jgi:hypothetical protein
MEHMEPITPETAQGLLNKDDTLAGELQTYHASIEAEFSGEDTDEFRTRMGRHVNEAEDAIAYLLINADSESVRLNAAKFVLGVVYGKSLADAEKVDPLTKLMDELRNNDNQRDSV